MSKSMKYLNSQRRVPSDQYDYNQLMPTFANECFDPLSQEQNQEMNPEYKINLVFGLLRKSTARTNGIWKVVQSIISRINELEKANSSIGQIDQIIKRNKELEDKRIKINKKKNERKRNKRRKKVENQLSEEDKEEKNSNNSNNLNFRIDIPKEVRINIPKEDQFRRENIILSSRNVSNNLAENFINTGFNNNINKNAEISRTNFNKNINFKNNFKNNLINKDEINFDSLIDNIQLNQPNFDECSLRLQNKININNEPLSSNGRNRQNVIYLANRFIFNNQRIFNSTPNWINNTFIPLIQDIIDLNLYELDVSEYVKRIRSPPEFRKEFWNWWKDRNQMMQC
jgi:hypothetical protein